MADKNGRPTKLSLKDILKAAKADSWPEAVVKLGYADVFGVEDHRFDFWVRTDDPEEAQKILSMVGQYNEYDGNAAGALVWQLITQGVVMYVEFGRECSPMLRVYVREPEANRDGVRSLLERLHPDELDDWGPHGLRAWWD